VAAPKDDPSAAPEWQLARLIEGYLTTQLTYVAAKLGIADLLAGGPKSGAELAAALGVHGGHLVRVLRGLVLNGLLSEEEDGRFALTEMGSLLRNDVPRSLRAAALARGEVYYEPAGALLQAVREGRTPFELVLGKPFFEHLAAHPDDEALFQGSMAGRSEREADDVVAAYDFTPFGKLVDVGGGQGILLRAILRSAPQLEAILLDRAGAIDDARERLEQDGHGARIDYSVGDFFVEVPAGADAYLLSRVIHDWEDEEARRILGNCGRAMSAESVLLVVEAILPERVLDQPGAVQMDLLMLLFLGARERTAAEYEQLLVESGFRLTRIVPTRSPAGLSLIEARLA
jgi:ubiquinone/menaquinone biosynthesis C-methylase UbiE